MSSVQINQLPAASTIDGTNDVLPIWNNGTSTTQKISRSIFLGVSGQPTDISSTQSLTNKSLDNTNTVTLKDTLFTLQDDSDTTKQAKFQLSGITTGTTRTYTVPNASVTLASLTGTETLTNKTITSPAITGGTYDNGAITVDSISGHTSSTTVTVANLQILNGVLNTANSVTATALAAGAVQPQALVAGTGAGWAWSSWVPTLTNLTLGNGTQVASFIQTGKTVIYRYAFLLGSTSVVGTNPTITLPVTAKSEYGNGSYSYETGYGLSSVAGTDYYIFSDLLTTTTFRPLLAGTGSTYLSTRTPFTASVPGAWTTGNWFTLTGIYEAG